MSVSYTHLDVYKRQGLCRVDENTHQRRSKHTDQTADNKAEYRRHRSGAADALADTLRLMRPVVLCLSLIHI